MDVPFGLKLRVPFTFKDANGNDAVIDGQPTVTTTNGTVVEVVGSGSAWSAKIAPESVGSFTVAGTADVDLGEGVATLAFALGDHLYLASPQANTVVLGTPSTE
jgi:hypothetical protein